MVQPKITKAVSFKRRFMTLSIPLLILVNLIFYWMYINQKESEFFILEQTAINRLSLQKEKIGKFSNNISSDLKIILNHHELLDFIDNEKIHTTQHLVHDLIQFAKFEKIYDQIRYIDTKGQEIIRINFNGGHPKSVKKESLQNKKDRYYFKDTIQLNKGELYMSPMDLNIENGEIEIPIKPMIRVGTPVFDRNNKKKGILFVNYMSSRLLDSMTEDIVSPTEQIFLVNRDGYFLKGSSNNEEWGFMYPDKKQITFEKKFPGLWQIVKENKKGSLINETGIFYFDTIFPLNFEAVSSTGAADAYSSSKMTIMKDEYLWKLVHFVSYADFFNRSLGRFKQNIIFLSTFVSMIIIVITWFLSLFLYKKKVADLLLKSAYEDLEQKVDQRVKELNCLYEMSKLSANQTLSIEVFLDRVIKIIPQGYRFPEITQCRIRLDKTIVQTALFNTRFYVLKAPFMIAGINRGIIEVTYSKKKEKMDEGPFQKEERALIDSIAKQVAGMISKKEDRIEKQKLEEQLLHSQKMEAIGHLSGGVAHDFNNILTVINGFAELGKTSTKEVSPLWQHFDAILVAGEKAANLTRQLLVFSRKDAIQPMPLQINSAIENAIKLLKRLVGENIRQTVSLKPGIPKIKADPTQIDQLLFNLVINARDAINTKNIRDKNTITITTKKKNLDEEFAETHLDIKPGAYILLEVTDTGIGMTKDVQKKIFTPFFSTKLNKNGTGLGLSTVYGIVRQNKGAISVYSEKSLGTTFKIYWPVIGDDDHTPLLKKYKPVSINLEHTVVLVVEDDQKLNQFACKTLQSKNIEVLSAFDGEQAIGLLKEHQTRVDMIFTDVVLPGMNGRELADEALKIHPGIRILYTSGYTETFFSEDGILPSGINFLRKPYSIQNLYQKLGTVLQGDTNPEHS